MQRTWQFPEQYGPIEESAASQRRAGSGEHRVSPSSTQAANDPLEGALTSFTDVRERTAAWLWPNWLPLGKLAILDGDPGLGKSTMLFDLAARVSKDGIMPDGTPGASGGVLILNAEDDPEDTIKPRLRVAGADMARVFQVSEVGPAGARRVPRIPADTALLGQLARQCAARLLIIDPFVAFLAGVDINRDQDIRQALLHLSGLAGQLGCTIVCVRHLNKGDSAKAVYRGAGSIGVIGHARTGLVVAQAPDNEDERVLAVAKSALVTRPVSLRFALEAHDVGGPQAICRVRWLGTAPYRADQLVERPAGPEQRARVRMDDACQEFLRRLLGYGGMPVKSVKAECADAGFSLRTIERAAATLGVELKRQYGLNMWTLPSADRPSAS